MKALHLKICGMRDATNIRDVEQLRPHIMGFICWPKSPRFVKTKPTYMPVHCARAGVFVNPTANDVMDTANRLGLTHIQLHGKERPSLCEAILKLSGNQLKIIKAFSIADNGAFPETADYEGLCEQFLFDTSCPTVGGSGRSFDWQSLDAYHGSTPFWISGGIGPEHVNELQMLTHPLCYGIDLNSKFETAPGMKDTQKLGQFITALRQNGCLLQAVEWHETPADMVQKILKVKQL